MQAVPGGGTNVPLWILGSSLYGAQVAAHFGLPYAFASHFAPDALLPALAGLSRALPAHLHSWRSRTPWSGVNVIAAETDADGAAPVHLGIQQSFANIFRGTRG